MPRIKLSFSKIKIANALAVCLAAVFFGCLYHSTLCDMSQGMGSGRIDASKI